jgi:hypothetical protein
MHAVCATYLVGALDVGALPREGHLDAGGAPGNKVHQLALTDTLQSLVHLRKEQMGVWMRVNGEDQMVCVEDEVGDDL